MKSRWPGCLVVAVAVAVASILLASCDAEWAIYVNNRSTARLIVEIRSSSSRVIEVGPGKQYLLERSLGPAPTAGTEVRVFLSDCTLIGTVRPTSESSLVDVDAERRVSVEAISGQLGISGDAADSFKACSPDLVPYVATPTPASTGRVAP